MLIHQRFRPLQLLLCASAILAVLVATAPVQAAHPHATYPPLRVQTSIGSPFVKNFNLCNANAYGNQGGAAFGTIYENLYTIDYEQYKEHPMLATAYTWSKDLKTLTFTIRSGVKWSDGQPMTAKDVYFSLWTLPKTTKIGFCDPLGLNSTRLADSVTMPASNQVAIHFKTVDSTRFFSLVNASWISPEHIYSQHLKDMASWQDTNPVGTGPFTELQNFTPQSFDLGKNPNYWQPGKPAIDVLRVQTYTSQDAANLALEAGQSDWSNATIVNVSKLYDARNPQYYHHFYGGSLCDNALALLDVKYPYSLVPFRKALSMAINRKALTVNADYGTEPPANVQGTDPWPAWTDKGIPQALVQYNPQAARDLLKKAGFTWQNNKLIDPKGKPVTMNLIPTFYPAEGSIMAQNFKDIGIDVTIQNLQFGTYYDKMLKGQFDAVDEWCNGGQTPYWWYESIVDVLDYAPVGQNTPNYNFERWHDPTMDKLFAQYRQTIDSGKQHRIINQMQKIFADNLPVIPTVMEIVTSNYNTQNYTGFPDASNNYAYADPFGYPPDTELILLNLRRTH
jgi:peptide/nickel transport system substrate-binding protein